MVLGLKGLGTFARSVLRDTRAGVFGASCTSVPSSVIFSLVVLRASTDSKRRSAAPSAFTRKRTWASVPSPAMPRSLTPMTAASMTPVDGENTGMARFWADARSPAVQPTYSSTASFQASSTLRPWIEPSLANSTGTRIS